MNELGEEMENEARKGGSKFEIDPYLHTHTDRVEEARGGGGEREREDTRYS